MPSSLTSVGIDISSSAVRVVKLFAKSAKHPLRLLDHRSYELAPSIIELGKVVDPLSLSRVLRQVKKDIRHKEAFFGIPKQCWHESCVHIPADTQVHDQAYIETYLQKYLKDQFVLPLQDLVCEYDLQQQGRYGSYVRISVGEKKRIEEYFNVITGAGFTPRTIESRVAGMVRSCVPKDDTGHLLVGMDRDDSFWAWISNGVIMQSSATPVAAAELPSILSKFANIAPDRAAGFVERFGISADLHDPDFYQHLRNGYLRDLLHPLQSLVHTLRSQSNQYPLERVPITNAWVVGEHADMPGLDTEVARHTGIPTMHAHAWHAVDELEDVPSMTKTQSRSFAGAIGLAAQKFVV